uniref:NADH-ubiquinone oxidoreductase chain 3 n=1 Tax=Amblyomma testudinarium TaxID=375577 RepID=A0A7U3LM23_AMBTS|nr:NADH dehydrogenase subunit 3 [Amblyomma testudinarium]UNO54293.1 NADH dehydrogenase subunit 3 [Amblyomma testudinarium]BCG44738.1 NADH dehydrogenase subunit 3 [Amblyomma testudinarium]BCG67059.1 NADH dehydrogenase subunit 3 [Amblyomma testudinarium]BCG67072.1 NADH dehydrogenase subunit 3 [Amblyomma testudinarium]BCG67085.1 NADH dehydrogenase subunit 3 [Amblyomma testudinarium]
MYVYMYIIFIILILIFMLFMIIFFKNTKSKEKLSPFECGFDPFSLSRVPFSLKFFFIAIIFLIFDVEIIIIMPYPILLFNKSFSLMLSFMMINLIIMFGLFFEWKNGMIDWMK